MGDVQKSLGVYSASSYILQVKNPQAPPTGPQQVHSKPAEYPTWVMHDIFGQGERGRSRYGLRFVPCGTPELLDYRGAELLFIAAREGEEGLEKSLGEGRGVGKGHVLNLCNFIQLIHIPFSLSSVRCVGEGGTCTYPTNLRRTWSGIRPISC